MPALDLLFTSISYLTLVVVCLVGYLINITIAQKWWKSTLGTNTAIALDGLLLVIGYILATSSASSDFGMMILLAFFILTVATHSRIRSRVNRKRLPIVRKKILDKLKEQLALNLEWQNSDQELVCVIQKVKLGAGLVGQNAPSKLPKLGFKIIDIALGDSIWTVESNVSLQDAEKIIDKLLTFTVTNNGEYLDFEIKPSTSSVH